MGGLRGQGGLVWSRVWMDVSWKTYQVSPVGWSVGLTFCPHQRKMQWFCLQGLLVAFQVLRVVIWLHCRGRCIVVSRQYCMIAPCPGMAPGADVCLHPQRKGLLSRLTVWIRLQDNRLFSSTFLTPLTYHLNVFMACDYYPVSEFIWKK